MMLDHKEWKTKMLDQECFRFIYTYIVWTYIELQNLNKENSVVLIILYYRRLIYLYLGNPPNLTRTQACKKKLLNGVS